LAANLILCALIALFAAEPSGLNPQVARISVLTQDAAPEAIIGGQRDSDFVASASGVVDMPEGQARWLKITLVEPWPDPLDPPHLRLTNLRRPGAEAYAGGRLVGVARFGADQGWARYVHRTGRFDLPGGGDLSIYVRVRPAVTATRLYPSIVPRHVAYPEEIARIQISIATFSMMLAMGISGLVLYLLLRQRIYAAYAGQAFGIGAYFLIVSGEIYRFDWVPRLPSAMPALTCALVIGVMYCCLNVTHGVLITGTIAPRSRQLVAVLNRILIWSSPLALVGLVFPQIANRTALAAAFLIMWAMVGVTLSAVRNGSRPSWPMLLAWAPNWFLATLAALPWNQIANSGQVDFAFPLFALFATAMPAWSLTESMMAQRTNLILARKDAKQDGLTGVLNRAAIEGRLADAFETARRAGQSMAMLFIDLDHFKRLNDTFGHAAGDASLRSIIDPIRHQMRTTDDLGRWGGEEFVVVLPGATADTALSIAERMRRVLSELVIDFEGTAITLTASIGVAAISSEQLDYGQMVAAADRALYNAKHAGRNRVALAPSN
jgi:diguanylate cyclase (GGDEF)-like protein